jgi:hypothetical protein
MHRCAVMVGVMLASTAGADELAPRTRALLHEALEARLKLPTEPPSLSRPLPPPPLPAAVAPGARPATDAAVQAAQTAAANHAAQDVANGRARVDVGGEPNEASRNAAGQARAAEARATGGVGASHGKPPGTPGNGPGNGKGNGKGN